MKNDFDRGYEIGWKFYERHRTAHRIIFRILFVLVGAAVIAATAVGCTGAAFVPTQPQTAGETGQGWTDANQMDAARVVLFDLRGPAGAHSRSASPGGVVTDDQDASATDGTARPYAVTLTGNNITIDVWVQATSGNERAGQGGTQSNQVGDANQSPSTDAALEIPLPLP